MSELVPFAYLGCLLFSLFGMLVLDARHRLFWFADWRSAAIVHSVGVAAFLLWDAAGIATGVFFRGQTEFMTGVLLAPELPLEELFFLIFLCWLTMNLWELVSRGLAELIVRRERRRQQSSGVFGGRDSSGGRR